MDSKKQVVNKSKSLAVRKSNSFISAIYSLDAISAKIFSICLTHVEIRDGVPVSSVRAGEFKDLLGKQDTNIYTKLKTASKKLLDPKILIENEDGSWIAFNMVSTVSYKNSIFNMEMSRELTPHVSDLLGQYTTYEVEQILPLSKYSIRLYEKLKSDAWRANRKMPMVVVEYDLSELKFELGAIEMDPQEIQQLRKKNYSWQAIEDLVEDSSMKRWGNFKTRVLDKAQKEFEKNNTDLGFEYMPIRGGIGGAVRRIRFSIWNNNPKLMELPESLRSFLGHNSLSEGDLSNFFRDANGDESAVIRAIDLADRQVNIKNYVGWIRSCIKDNYSRPVETIKGSKEAADKVQGILKNLQEAQDGDPNGEFFVNMWEKAMARPEMEDFMSGMSLEERQYFDLYDYKDRVESFLSWKRENAGC